MAQPCFAWTAGRQRLVPGLQATAEKSNEIKAISLLLERLVLKGCIVMIDAMGTTRQASCALKRPPGSWPSRSLRRYAVCGEINGLLSDRSHPGEFKIPGLAIIGMVESETERDGRMTIERRYVLCSKVMTVLVFAAVVRGHWGIENRLRLGARRHLRRGPEPPAYRLRRRKLGPCQTHGAHPDANHQDQIQPQGLANDGGLEYALSRRHPGRRGVIIFKRFP